MIGVTVEHPYFEHSSGQRIFCMFDPPHLFKSVRNNLLKYVFQIGENGQYVDLQYIQRFYDCNSKQALRLCPKLTMRHMEVTNFSKMKVSYAVQIFSKSVALKVSPWFCKALICQIVRLILVQSRITSPAIKQPEKQTVNFYCPST